MKEIKFISADRSIPFRKRQRLKKCIYELFQIEGLKLKKISYIFCSDKFLLELNKQYLNHDYYTDVITFLISSKNEPIESEIYISSDRIKENAKTFKVSHEMELIRVMIHGALHLCAYNDKTKKERIKMQGKENFYIQLYTDSRET